MINIMFLGVNGSVQATDGGNTSLLFWGSRGCFLTDVSCHIREAVDAGIDAVLLTHEHIDHVYGLPSLIHQMWLSGRKKTLEIYVPKSLDQWVNQFLDLFQLREKKNMFEIRICTETQFSVGSMSVALFSTDHTKQSVGLIVREGAETLIYTADTRPIKDMCFDTGSISVLIHEASGLSEEQDELVKKGHSSGADAGKLAAALQAEKLYLCHLPSDEQRQNQICKEAALYFKKTEIPELLKKL